MKKIGIAIFFIVVLFATAASIISINKLHIIFNKAAELQTPSVNMIAVDMDYNVDNTPVITINNVEAKPNLAPRSVDQEELRQNEKSYSIDEINENGQTVATYYFIVNDELRDDSELFTKEKTVQQAIKLKQIHFVVTFPLYQNAVSINLKDHQGNLIGTKEIIHLARARQVNPLSLAQLAESRKYLHVAVVSSGYSTDQMEQFHGDVDRIKNRILSIDPFKTRFSQIQFHPVDNIDDLGCGRRWPDTPRLLGCDYGKVTNRINNSGVLYDTIIVVVNDNEYGGSGIAGIAVTYDGELADLVAVHEFGHSFGRLLDEYSYGDEGAIDNIAHVNCYAGNPPLIDWSNLDNVQYVLGCTHDNWYRSASSSIMSTLDSSNFNNLSRRLVNQRLDAYVGVFAPVLNLKLKFQGITQKPSDQYNRMNVRITVTGGSLSSPLVQTVKFTSDNVGIWSGRAALNLTSGSNYSILVKGPKHIQKRVCDQTPHETGTGLYRCSNGSITINSGDNTLDFSGITQMSGDLPIQDGIVNSSDLSQVINSLGKSDPEVLTTSDINLDGIVNTYDYSLIIPSSANRTDDF